jgi:hypothetical protein
MLKWGFKSPTAPKKKLKRMGQMKYTAEWWSKKWNCSKCSALGRLVFAIRDNKVVRKVVGHQGIMYHQYIPTKKVKKVLDKSQDL